MTKTALETVQHFQQSMGSGGDEWESLMAEDIVFKGPIDTVEGREANIQLNKGFMPMVQGYAPINAFTAGAYATLEGTYTISTPSGGTMSFTAAEVYEIKAGKIQNIRIYYDAEEFRKEFGR